MSIDKSKKQLNSITKKELEKIKERDKKMNKLEKIRHSHIQIRIDRFCCTNCGSTRLRRTTQYGRKEKYGNLKKVRFRCKKCHSKSYEIYDKKQGHCIEFKKYSKIIDRLDKNG